jgi:protein-S-isoprenylcysteine O-methyltransferase Ste14
MATLKYKIGWFRQTKYFAIYDRHIYNISSGVVLWIIFANLTPSFIYLFTVPSWLCLPIVVAAAIMLMKATVELGGRIMMPFRLKEIMSERYLTYGSYEAKGLEGLKQSGVYAYVRNPMQGAVILLMIFGNGVYTTERLLYVAVMVSGVIVGVLMEERRMLIQFKEYKGYMENVKARFIPYLI